jgi:hypothetical protein
MFRVEMVKMSGMEMQSGCEDGSLIVLAVLANRKQW